MSYEEVVFRRSYINILLLNRSIPSYKTKDDEDGNGGGLKGYNEEKLGGAFVTHHNPRSGHANDFFAQFV